MIRTHLMIEESTHKLFLCLLENNKECAKLAKGDILMWKWTLKNLEATHTNEGEK